MELTFSELIKGNKPVVVDFYADWCGPCRMMKPVLEEVKQKVGEDAIVIKIDVDRSPSSAELYRVSGIPTLMIFKNGKMMWRHSGLIPAAKLIEQINNYK